MDQDTIQLTLHQEPAAPLPQATAPVLPLQPNVALFGAGGFGSNAVRRTVGLCALDGNVPAGYTFDNAASPPVALTLPDGRAVNSLLPPESHLYLNTGNRRDALLEYPLLARRYHRLLRGFWVADSENSGVQGGNGGGTQPLMTLIDLDLKIERVRAWVRRALQQAMGLHAEGEGVLGRLWSRREQAQEPLFVLVVAGRCGAAGAGASLLLGYLIRDEARKLGLARPTSWLLLAGPVAFHGLTKRTWVSYGATLEALRHLAQYGIDRPGIDGENLREQAAPYDRIWALDDPRLPADGTTVTPRESEAFSARVAAAARALLLPAVRAAYLDRVANGAGADESPWPGFGTLSLGQGGFAPQLLAPYLAALLAQRRATDLADRLAST
ncbi:MAG: hypothetical protein M3Z04_00885 [Chloroflexota bacterium]|nr:hypothetical protein [Chloroflexota bacterium]